MHLSPMPSIVLAAGILSSLGPARARTVAVETVVVGNPGNPGEQSRLPAGDPTFYGGVDYAYAIGTFEVTAGQYTAFLNAVATTDIFGLYHPRMDHDSDPDRDGCNIQRDGEPGSHAYSVAPDWANRPVNYVSWADAARFANWLHNGQPTGAQNLSTTEDGSYFLDGVSELDDDGLEEIMREPDATWVIPSEDEWYKAAYHKNDGVTQNYWNYPTSADDDVSNELVDPDPGNNATFQTTAHTIGAPYYRTEAGAHENSASPYGTFDQGGNVQEFTEAVPESDIRRMRGGSWRWGRSYMSAGDVDDVMHSSDQLHDLGFRLVQLAPVPLPVSPDGAGAGIGFTILGAHPLRAVARFQVELPEATRVRLDVFDAAGRRLPGHLDVPVPAGTSEIAWPAKDLPPGVYFARVTALGASAVIRLVRVE